MDVDVKGRATIKFSHRILDRTADIECIGEDGNSKRLVRLAKEKIHIIPVSVSSRIPQCCSLYK